MIEAILKEACWIKTSTIKFYHKNKDGTALLYISKEWLLYTVKAIANERWKVTGFKSKSDAVKDVLNNFEYFKQDEALLRRYNDAKEYNTPLKDAVDRYVKVTGSFLPRHIENMPEIAIKMFVKGEQVLSNKQLFDLLVGKEKLQIDTFKDLFGFVAEDSERISHLKHNNWDVWFDVKTGKDVREFINLLDEIEKVMAEKNLRYLCYGNVFAVDTLKSDAIADYLINKDSLRIAFKDSKRNSTLSNVIKISHELAHRHWYKFADTKFKTTVMIKYEDMKDKTPSYNVGSQVTSSDGSVFSVEDKKEQFLSAKPGLYYVLKLQDKSDKPDITAKLEVGKTYQIPDKTMGISFVGKDEINSERKAFIPRSYGLKNVEEFYAVLMETYVGNSIQEPAKTWLEGLFK